jgi:hypothetical protein
MVVILATRCIRTAFSIMLIPGGTEGILEPYPVGGHRQGELHHGGNPNSGI